MRKNGGIFKNKMEEDIEMKIYHAQVNHLENPMGFRMERTVFSWKVKDAEGKKQSYARIRVASDAAIGICELASVVGFSICGLIPERMIRRAVFSIR